ncbi:hypothetical protein MPC4_80107 [Methylocella tundrae]|uniref:Uncharacterized protein n=1 Tax=Methylocella tundrae TaxID=227605 RepID=A0A8B6MDD2_METTU|nr:hypothetical protein MPC1_13090002 [Methylocella tundrae]VTZ52436.1 hypothetical protein MPC4_80107 [Methylocella tundrae]
MGGFGGMPQFDKRRVAYGLDDVFAETHCGAIAL